MHFRLVLKSATLVDTELTLNGHYNYALLHYTRRSHILSAAESSIGTLLSGDTSFLGLFTGAYGRGSVKQENHSQQLSLTHAVHRCLENK